MNLRAGIIGCGAIAREHLEALRSVEGIVPYAYCDVVAERARLFLNEWGGEYAGDSIEQMMRDDRVDVVYICTLHDSHAPIALAACEAGKGVMMEKPMALTVEECRAIGEAVDRSGITLMTAFKLRYYPLVRQVMEFITTPTLTIAQVMDSRWSDEFWGQHPTKGGGNVLSQGCHAVDLVCYMNRSQPMDVTAAGGTFNHRDTEVIDTLAATMTLQSGSVASLTHADSGATPYVSKWSFQMVDGVRSVHLHDRLKRATFFDGDRTWSEESDREYGMIEENRAFAEALRNGTAPPSTWHDGFRATSIIRTAFRSLQLGRRLPVELPR